MLRVSRFKSVIAPDPSIGYTKRARGRWGAVVELDGGLILALAVLGHICYGIPENKWTYSMSHCDVLAGSESKRFADFFLGEISGFVDL